MTGIAVLEDVNAVAGVETLEGDIGPLLRAARGGAHFIRMHPGMYLEEHAHETESLIYTVSGRWVLCSGGERRVMPAGSLFWFGDNVPTGYELPFDEDAYLLIFKPGERPSDDEFVEYLTGMAAELVDQQASGTAFSFDALPDDHPARVFARTLEGNNLGEDGGE